MWNRFIRAMEYRSYCMAIQSLRSRGMYKEAQRISEYKHSLYYTSLNIKKELFCSSFFMDIPSRLR